MNDCNLPKIEFELHDSYIDAISFGPGRSVLIIVYLYPIFYPEASPVELRFGGILNYKKVNSYFNAILNDADDEIGCGIDAFHYSTRKISKVNDYYFFLDTQWEGRIEIHCSEFSMIKTSGK